MTRAGEGGRRRDPRRFLELGLKTNPFVEIRPDDLAAELPPPYRAEELLGSAWEILQISGECGSGKTTHLVYIGARLSERVGPCQWHLLADGETRLAPATRRPLPRPGSRTGVIDGSAWTSACVLVIDEAQRLDANGRRDLAAWRRADGRRRLVLGTHEDLGPCLAGSGEMLAVTLGPPGRDYFGALYEARLSRVRFGSGPGFPIEPGALDAAIELAGGLPRRFVVLLYFAFEVVERPGPLTADRIEAALDEAGRFLEQERD